MSTEFNETTKYLNLKKFVRQFLRYFTQEGRRTDTAKLVRTILEIIFAIDPAINVYYASLRLLIYSVARKQTSDRMIFGIMNMFSFLLFVPTLRTEHPLAHKL
jgi:hypothetical protein